MRVRFDSLKGEGKHLGLQDIDEADEITKCIHHNRLTICITATLPNREEILFGFQSRPGLGQEIQHDITSIQCCFVCKGSFLRPIESTCNFQSSLEAFSTSEKLLLWGGKAIMSSSASSGR